MISITGVKQSYQKENEKNRKRVQIILQPGHRHIPIPGAS